MSPGVAEKKSQEEEWDGQESSRKRPHTSSRGEDHESVGKSTESKQRRLDTEAEVQGASSTKDEQFEDVALGMAPHAPVPEPLPGMFEQSNTSLEETNANFNQLVSAPSSTEGQSLPLGNHPLFVGPMSMGAQMAGMGMQANPALFQQQFFLANRSYPLQMNMPTAVPPQLALTQQQSLTAQQALTAASSVATQGRDANYDASLTSASMAPALGDASGQQHNALTMLPPQPQHQMLQPPQQQGLPVMPVGALPPGAPNPLQLQFLQRGPIPAPLSDADAAAFCNRVLLSGFPLAGGMAVPALFAQQINRQRVDGPILTVPTPRADGICLALSCDDEQLSEYQILVRKQLEIFEAQQEDVESNTQGRKKQVVLGQVGIRCRHCSGLPLRQRGRGAVYYPAKLQGVYQAAQNMASSHLCESCQYIPHPVKQDLRLLRERRDTASGGKQYWADGARAMGLYESEEGLKLRRGPLSSDNLAMA